MKFLFIIILFVSASAFIPGSSVYDYSIITADGNTHAVSEYAGKKIMIVILPATQTADDSAYLNRLDSLSQALTGQLQIIGVPSYEDGYTDDSTLMLMPWYQGLLDTTVILTKGMQTHIASGDQQEPLYSWLTHTEQNGHYNDEIGGAGQMFFINEQGDLYGVFGPSSKWSDKLINMMMQ